MKDIPESFNPAQIHTALGYQQKGLDFAKVQAKGQDLSPLLCAPHVLHAKPRSVPAGTRFELLHDSSRVNQREVIQFDGFGKAPNGDILLNFLHEGVRVSVQTADPDAAISAKGASGPRKAAKGNKLELPAAVPGEVLVYNVKPGDVLKAGGPLVVLESMKMEMKISVPDELDGLKVKALPCRIRTKTDQGDILSPGDLLIELEE